MLLSASLTTIVSESILIIEKLLWSLYIWCDAMESISHFGEAARALAVSQEGSQSSVIASAAVAVALVTLHQSIIRMEEMHSALMKPGSPY